MSTNRPPRVNFRTAKSRPPISQKLSRALLTGMVVRYKFAQKASISRAAKRLSRATTSMQSRRHNHHESAREEKFD
jgi:hypothetical protein